MMDWRYRAAIRVARIVVVFIGLGAVVWFYRATAFANATTVALSLLLIVLAVAARWGLVEAIAASVFATLCFNYFFLPPVGTFTIADPQNWIALLAFLVVSVVASQLSERARRKAGEAIEHQQETERLYTVSRMILMLGGSPAHVAGEISRQIQQVFEAAGVTLFHSQSGQVFRAGQEDVPLSDAQLKEVTLQGSVTDNLERSFTAFPVSLGGKPLGSLGILGAPLSDGARQALANLVAIALEAAHNREVVGHAEVVRKSEEFKSTLLDALAHELRTPLTSLQASAGALLTVPSDLSASQRELLTIIEEETDRLNRLITEVLQMARIEAGELRLKRGAYSAETLVREAWEDAKRLLEGRDVRLRIAPELPLVFADADLIRTVLKHLLDNAAKYSSPGKPITIAVEPQDENVCISVTDQGPGLTEQELTQVFEKYFRGVRTRETVPGIGMGLAIARDIIAAHGGRIWVDRPPGQGARFSFTLPSVETRVAR
jgi:two-component system sensor histidine kinase KdpD